MDPTKSVSALCEPLQPTAGPPSHVNPESVEAVAFQHCPATGRALACAAVAEEAGVAEDDGAEEPLEAPGDTVDEDVDAELHAASATAKTTSNIGPDSRRRPVHGSPCGGRVASRHPRDRNFAPPVLDKIRCLIAPPPIDNTNRCPRVGA
jgi:hypothetical protein